MFEQTINIDRMEHAVALFGSFDENIKLIENEYGVTILSRGSDLKLTGEPENVGPVSYTHLEDPGLPMVVVSDGDVYDEALKIVGFDVNWLNKILKEQNVKLEDVFIMTTDRAQNFQIVKKEAKE